MQREVCTSFSTLKFFAFGICLRVIIYYAVVSTSFFSLFISKAYFFYWSVISFWSLEAFILLKELSQDSLLIFSIFLWIYYFRINSFNRIFYWSLVILPLIFSFYSSFSTRDSFNVLIIFLNSEFSFLKTSFYMRIYLIFYYNF